MSYTKNPTASQKKIWTEQAEKNKKEAFKMIKGVAEGYRENPQKMIEYFQFSSRFYQYSQNNVSLIYAQNENAMFVQSFKEWKDMGASVKRGARGLKILVPVQTTYLKLSEDEFVKLSEASEELKMLYKSNQIESVKKLHFSIGNVFDISQTTYPKEKYPELLSMGKESIKHKTIEKALVRFAEEKLSCPVRFVDLESIGLKGRYLIQENKIELNALLEDTERLSVVSHELGHALIHNGMPPYSLSQIEFEGDALSIMLQSENGIEIPEARQRHIATHYNQFRKECNEIILRENPNLSREEMDERIDKILMESFNNVFEVYRENIDTINQYIKEEVEKETLLDNKTIQLLVNNGVKEEFIKKSIKDSTLKKDGLYACIYKTEKGELIIPLNNFIVPADIDIRNEYYEGIQEQLYVTGNRIEFLANLSNGKDVLLLEREDFEDVKEKIQKSYQSISFGLNVSADRKKINAQLGIAETVPIHHQNLGIEL